MSNSKLLLTFAYTRIYEIVNFRKNKVIAQRCNFKYKKKNHKFVFSHSVNHRYKANVSYRKTRAEIDTG